MFNRVKGLTRAETLVILYVFLISAWFVSWIFIGDGNWWLILINRIVPYLFLPLPLFLAWIIIARKFGLIFPLSLPIIIFVSLYHPYLLPKLATPVGSKSQLRVMTYNVLYSNQDYDAVANIILTYHPDLVALQEVQQEMMDGLERRLATEYPYFNMGTKNEFGTTAIFGQYPFADSYTLDLRADRPASVVKTKVQDREITFVAVHLLAYGLWWVELKDIPATAVKRTSDQNRQVEILLDEIKNEDGIVVIGCDCNSKETSSSYRMLAESLDNAARKTGWLLDQNQLAAVSPDIALQHIDYVWYRGKLEPFRVYTLNDSGGSDHLPVLAIFSLD